MASPSTRTGRMPWPRVRAWSAILLASLLCLSCLPDRVTAAELDRLTRVLSLEPGDTVADVGAGDGKWSVRLARVVGAEGRVLATEVEESKVEKIEKRAKREKAGNVTALRGDQNDTGLPADCCDAILVRMVYHHFLDPASMRASLRRAMRQGALIAIIETEPQKGWDDVDGDLDRGGHGIPVAQLLEEMTSDGFELVERLDSWKGPHGDPYCLVFRGSGGAVRTSR
jgi:ubiquinone/menaquinone biosynthesis C-methylase UbiE